jgi:hypothetical protein
MFHKFSNEARYFSGCAWRVTLRASLYDEAQPLKAEEELQVMICNNHNLIFTVFIQFCQQINLTDILKGIK